MNKILSQPSTQELGLTRFSQSLKSDLVEPQEQKLTLNQSPQVSTLVVLTDYLPMVGATLTHNLVHNYFMQRSIQYVQHDPLLNTFVNLPISAMAGTAAFLVAKGYLKPEDQAQVSSDLKGVQKAIAWAGFFNLIYSFTMKPNMLMQVASSLSIFGGPSLSLSIAAVNLIGSLYLFDLAKEVFQDQTELFTQV